MSRLSTGKFMEAALAIQLKQIMNTWWMERSSRLQLLLKHCDSVLMGNFDSSHFWILVTVIFLEISDLFYFFFGGWGVVCVGFSVPWGLTWIPLFIPRVQALFVYTNGAFVGVLCKMSLKIKEVWTFQGRDALNQPPLCLFQPLTLWSFKDLSSENVYLVRWLPG